MGFLDFTDKDRIYKYVVTISIIVFVVIAGNKLKTLLEDHNSDNADYKLIRDFLLNDNERHLAGGGEGLAGLTSSSKQPLWIHLPYEINARVWESFGSRNTTHLNQTYLHFTIQSMIQHCGRDMNICLIDDSSFERLLPDSADEWTWGNLQTLTEPARGYYRQVGLLKLVYRYGGVVVPSSFLTFRNLKDVFKTNTNHSYNNNMPFVAENAAMAAVGSAGSAASISAKTGARNPIQGLEFVPDPRFFGCRIKKHEIMKEWIDAALAFTNHGFITSETKFQQYLSQWCYLHIQQKRTMQLIKAEQLGVMTISPATHRKTPLTVDELFSSAPEDLVVSSSSSSSSSSSLPDKGTQLPAVLNSTTETAKQEMWNHGLGIWIPAEEILRRSKYQWFAVVSMDEILTGDYLLAHFFRQAAASMMLVESSAKTQCTASKLLAL
jgi:hypothetical protein